MSEENVPRDPQLCLQLTEYFRGTGQSDMWIRNPFADGLSTSLLRHKKNTLWHIFNWQFI